MNLSDKNFESLLTVITPFAMGELEEVVSFAKKDDQQREEIMKVCLKSLEVTVVMFSKLIKNKSLDEALLEKLFTLVKEDNLQEAAAIINKS